MVFDNDQARLVKTRIKINEFLEKFKSEGGFDSLSDKYLSEEKKAFEELGITFFFD